MTVAESTLRYSARAMRAARWSALRQQLRKSKARVAEAKRTRKRRLKAAREACAAERQAVTAGCASRRGVIRSKAQQKLGRERALRDEARSAYRFLTGKGPMAKTRRYSRSESDSLAAHNVAPHLLEVWRKTRHMFSYQLQPDHRAELFSEWVQSHPDQVAAMRTEAAEETDWAAMEAEYYKEAAG